MIGKWHLKSQPMGFDYWNILPGQGEYHDPEMIEMGTTTKYSGYVTDIITDKAIAWLKGRNSEKPFCLMYQHKAPHRHWQPDEKHANMYEDTDIPLPETFDDDWSTRSAAAHDQEMTIEYHLVERDLKVPPPEGLEGEELKKWKYQRYIKDYLRCVASVDDNVGRFLDYLDDARLTENTIVVYTSDQGFYLGDHGWFDKRFMYEESLRMPLLVRYPKKVKAGSVNDDIVLNIDFAPTFLDFAGVQIPDDIQGESIRPLLQGKTPDDWRSSMYYHYYEYPGWHMVKRHYGVRTERYKLIHFYYDIDAWELYDLKKDPDELNNVYGEPAYADVVAELKKELAGLRKKYGDSDELAQRYIEENPEGDMPANWQRRGPAPK
jgi:arylsulfatase A-like enzyme